MFLTIAEVLDEKARVELTDALGKLPFRDGKSTAGRTAARVKDNLQADLSGAAGAAVRETLKAAILAHPVFAAAARPHRLSPLLVSKTTNGGHYGTHIDNALMKTPEGLLRTDLSFSLGLTPPEDYDGGELVVHLPGSTERVKPAAGDLVLYPSTAIHEVTPVTRGERIVCVGWVQSLIADPGAREILFDLENLRASLRAALPAGSAELLTLDKAIANLLRLYALR